jgi:hypothetical protein
MTNQTLHPVGESEGRESGPVLDEPWILGADVTVKPLDGHQEGAVKGYKPTSAGAAIAQLTSPAPRAVGAARASAAGALAGAAARGS